MLSQIYLTQEHIVVQIQTDGFFGTKMLMEMNPTTGNIESLKETRTSEMPKKVREEFEPDHTTDITNLIRVQWDDNGNIIKFINEKKYVSTNEVDLKYSENKEIIHFEDNLGNYWDKDEFTIPNPYNLKVFYIGLDYLLRTFWEGLVKVITQTDFDVLDDAYHTKMEMLNNLKKRLDNDYQWKYKQSVVAI